MQPMIRKAHMTRSPFCILKTNSLIHQRELRRNGAVRYSWLPMTSNICHFRDKCRTQWWVECTWKIRTTGICLTRRSTGSKETNGVSV